MVITIHHYTIEYWGNVIILSNWITGQRVDLYYHDIHSILQDYYTLDFNQFILTHGKDPFKLNNFEDSILQELMIKVKNELINSN